MNDSEFLTNKDDDDPILEFQNVEIQHLKPKLIDTIPFYAANSAELVALTLQQIENDRSPFVGNEASQKSPKARTVLPLDPYRMMWIRMSKAYSDIARNTFLNIPDGAGMAWIAKRYGVNLTEPTPLVSYIMNVIRLAQAKEYTIFILASGENVAKQLFFSLTRSFPKLRIVGKSNGLLKGEKGERVIEALRKTDPHIILLGIGYHPGMKWIRTNSNKIGRGILINAAGHLNVFAGQKKKAPDSVATRNLTWLWRSINSPLRWHRALMLFGYFIRVQLISWFFKKKNASN